MALVHWIWLSELKISRRIMHQLLSRFGDPQRMYEADAAAIRALRLSEAAEAVLMQPRDLSLAKAILTVCEKKNIGIVTMQDAAYPNRLRNIEIPPVLLYVGGHMPSFDEEAAVAVVGTRKCSGAAQDIAYKFGYELAAKGMLVISGMAMGIDSSANIGAIDAGAKTVAVLGCGIDVCYPKSSQPLYDRILAGNGCLISEYAPGSRPERHHFPERNRIMSGLAAGVLVIAAPEKSGSLITANLALDQGREIFVVPGGVDDFEFVGSNQLIKQGAIPVTSPKDLVAYYYSRFPDAFDAGKISLYMQTQTDGADLVRFHRREEPLQVASRPQYEIMGKPLEHPREHQPKAYDFSIFSKFSQKGKKEKRRTQKKEREFSDFPPVAVPRSIPVAEEKPKLSPELQKIADVIRAAENHTAHIDEIVNQSGFPAAEVLSQLTELEIEGVIEALPGKRFHIV